MDGNNWRRNCTYKISAEYPKYRYDINCANSTSPINEFSISFIKISFVNILYALNVPWFDNTFPAPFFLGHPPFQLNSYASTIPIFYSQVGNNEVHFNNHLSRLLKKRTMEDELNEITEHVDYTHHTTPSMGIYH